jgi:hypothetical protein
MTDQLETSGATPLVLCADYSRQAGAPLIGTATHVKVWLLLEYTLPWGKFATDENELPAPAQAWLKAQLESVPVARLQFIRQRSATTTGGVTFFVALGDEPDTRLYRLRLDGYEALPDVDLAGLIAGKAEYAHYLTPGPLYLVCGNTRRDASCARYGVAFLEKLTGMVGAAAWQTTHLGGHRFAGTGVVFPSGLCYGYLRVEDAERLVAATNAGRVVLDRLRGRAAYAEPAQAADYFLRETTGELGITAYHLESVENPAQDSWQVTFVGQADGARHQLTVEQRPFAAPVYRNTGDAEPAQISEFYLAAHRTA